MQRKPGYRQSLIDSDDELMDSNSAMKVRRPADNLEKLMEEVRHLNSNLIRTNIMLQNNDQDPTMAERQYNMYGKHIAAAQSMKFDGMHYTHKLQMLHAQIQKDRENRNDAKKVDFEADR